MQRFSLKRERQSPVWRLNRALRSDKVVVGYQKVESICCGAGASFVRVLLRLVSVRLIRHNSQSRVTDVTCFFLNISVDLKTL